MSLVRPSFHFLLPVAFLVPAGTALVSQAASAQSLDPSLLRNLQSQLGASDTPQVQPTDSDQQSQPVGEGVLSGNRVDTLEEQEVRRAEARRQLSEIYMPSEVERDYRRRLGDRNLRQFGYDFFQSAPPPTGVRSGAIGDDYVLGIGDQIQVSFRGATNRTQTVRVDRDGQIVVGDLRPIPAAGRSLGSIRNDLAAETKRTLLATDVYVSVGEVRSVSVFVGGEVERPGQFNLTSLSDVGTALAKAGGIRRSGSLRHVRIVRAGGGTVTVDLYGLLGIGTPPQVRLQDGDRVIVPVIGPTIAVTGAVARPGIYELRGASSVGAVVGFAGGAIRQRGAQVVISRIGPDGTESFIRAPGTGATIMAGDSVQVLAGSAGGAVGRVQLQGHVDNFGARPLVAAGTVAELVGSPSDLRSDTYQLAAVLVRRDPSSGARLFEVVNLARELRDRNSTPLQSEDSLFVFSRADITFMNSVAVRQVVLGQPNSMSQCKSLERLETLVKDTEASRFNAVTRAGLVVVSDEGAKLGAVGTALGQTSRRTTDQAVGGKQTRRADEDRLPECPKVFEDEPELLPVLIEHSISIGGAVRRPGAYPIGNLASARDLSLVADGLVVGARDLVLDINRSIGGPTERVQIEGNGSMMALTTLAPGDDIRFNAQQGVFEGSGVLLTGEVARPGLYSIRKGEKLSELLQRAGGLTSYGYAYGTIFTRRSVKEAQEEGFRRTARELNNSLLAIAARSSSSSGDGLAGAAALIQTLGTAEAPGRMVVEADPRVLDLRPDLDTIMEPGDSVFIPKRPNYVLALGDVNNPGALQFVSGKSAQNYLREAGGVQRTADDNRAFMVLPNGMAQPIGSSGRGGGTPPPGTTIIVPKNIDPLYRLSVFRDVTTIIAQLATSVATVAVLATN
ncbi:MAG: polysaccharide biosynthesis/export protein [Sphingomonas sp.]|nr:MAG: polysaccharide biosynthesis/export protein [Sphingomonas sp.]